MLSEEQLYQELNNLVDELLNGQVTPEEYEELMTRIMEDLEDLNA